MLRVCISDIGCRLDSHIRHAAKVDVLSEVAGYMVYRSRRRDVSSIYGSLFTVRLQWKYL